MIIIIIIKITLNTYHKIIEFFEILALNQFMYKFAVGGRRGRQGRRGPSGPSRAVGGRWGPSGAVGAIGGPLEAVGGRRGHRGADGPKGSYVRPVLYISNLK